MTKFHTDKLVAKLRLEKANIMLLNYLWFPLQNFHFEKFSFTLYI